MDRGQTKTHAAQGVSMGELQRNCNGEKGVQQSKSKNAPQRALALQGGVLDAYGA